DLPVIRPRSDHRCRSRQTDRHVRVDLGTPQARPWIEGRARGPRKAREGDAIAVLSPAGEALRALDIAALVDRGARISAQRPGARCRPRLRNLGIDAADIAGTPRARDDAFRRLSLFDPLHERTE